MDAIAEKKCPKCGETKAAAAYYKDSRNPGRLAYWCKMCHHGHCNGDRARAYRIAGKTALVALMGGRCFRCKGEFHPVAFDFVHRDPSDCKTSLSDLRDKRWDRILAESAKCDMLCSNCRRVAQYEAGTLGKNRGGKKPR